MPNFIFLDIGNTNTRWKYKNKYFSLPSKDFNFNKLPKSSQIWVSSVSKLAHDLRNSCANFAHSQEKYKSLTNAYSDTKSLGSDRWLAMITSYEISENNSFIMVDIGTAVTIDAVDRTGKHLGGLIFPGLEKTRESFDFFPVTSIRDLNGLGQSTKEGWTIGTLSIIINTINLKIKELKIELPDASIFITGGGYHSIYKFLEFDYAYHENLVLDGLELYANYVG